MDAFGHIVGYIDGNNVSTVSSFDGATGAVTGTGVGSSSAIQQLAYSWDGFGNLQQRCDANRGLVENFTNDDLNRLVTSQVYRGGTTGACTQGPTAGAAIGMQYDNIGNITYRSNTGITVGSGTLNDHYTYGDPNHPYAVTGVTSLPGTYVYDANGNMTSGNGRSITWNDDNLPTYIASTGTVNGNNTVTGSSTFSYGPDLQRYEQATTDSIAGNSTTTYVGGLFEVVASSGGTQYRHNILVAGGVVAVHTLDQSGNATTSYIHSDHLGSSDTLTGDTGAVSQQMSFDAFGLRRDANNWAYDLNGTQISSLKSKTDRGFTFQEQLDSVGLVHMNGRVYDPGVGRFISADPIEGGNRYAYVHNNPLNDTDPTGYWGLGDLIPSNPSSPLNPINVINTAGNAASGAINTLTGGAINPGFSISRSGAENALHHFDQSAANFLFRPDKTIEYNFPGLGNFTNVRFNHSKTMQRDVGYTVLAASVVIDVWSDGALTWATSMAYGGYESYVTSLNGGTMLQDAEQGGVAYATSYGLGEVNASWATCASSCFAIGGAALDADYGAASALGKRDSMSQVGLNALFHGLEGYSIGSLGQGIYNVAANPSSGAFTWASVWKYVTPGNALWAAEAGSAALGKSWFANDLGEDIGLSPTATYDVKAVMDLYSFGGPPNN